MSSRKRSLSPPPPPSSSVSSQTQATTTMPLPQQPALTTPQIFKSNPIEDRKSKFVAVYCPDPAVPVKQLQSTREFGSAMHRIAGWRRPSGQRTLGSTSSSPAVGKQVLVTGSDEDGEKYAGKKVEKVLLEMDVVGTVVVARWYGGILLGPVRFSHIENVAREAISLWKASFDGVDGDARKRRKVESTGCGTEGGGPDEQKEKEKLVRQLQQRDQSIKVLRDLLAEKTAGNKNGEKGNEDKTESAPTSPVSKLDYSAMPLQRLKQLDKARDASLAFILKQIDATEVKSKSWTTDRSPLAEQHLSSEE